MGKCGVIGEIRILSQECDKAECEWKIDQFFSLSPRMDANYFSPKVRIWNTVWIMRIFPNAIVESSNWIVFEFGKRYFDKDMRCSLSISTADGTKLNVLYYEPYNDRYNICRINKFLRRRALLSHGGSSSTLRVQLSLYRGIIPLFIDLSYAHRVNKEAAVQYYNSCPGDDWDFSEMDNPTTSRAGEEEDDWGLSEVDNPTASRVEESHLELKAKIIQFFGYERKNPLDAFPTETAGDTKAPILKFNEPQRPKSLDAFPGETDRDTKAERFVSRETQTEESLDAGCRETARDIKGDSPLRRHLQDLLVAGDDHDVILKVKDQEFKAHKCILRSRSPVLAAMFKHKMKESEDGRILIEDCDPEFFGDFLNYVYTEKVEDLSPSKAIGLHYTADKYDFTGLKEICVEYLKASLSATVVCDVISMATMHGENDLLECAVNFFSKHAEEIITTVQWQRFGEKNFVAANELYIKALKENRK